MRKPAPPRDIPPPLEMECLKALWTIGEGNVKAVRAALAGRRNLAYTTVMTLLERLARKGVVERRKLGRSFVYSPLVTRDTMRRRALRELIDTLFDGSEALLTACLGDEKASAGPSGEAAPSPEHLDTTLL